MIDEWESLTLTWKDLDPLIEEERTKPLVMPTVERVATLVMPDDRLYAIQPGVKVTLQHICEELGFEYRFQDRRSYTTYTPDPPRIEAEEFLSVQRERTYMSPRRKQNYPDQPKNDAETIERQRAYEQAMREQMEYVKRYAEAKLPKT